MPDLIAQGTQPDQRWRRSLPVGQDIVVGRAAGRWSVGWDHRISRAHVRLHCVDGMLHIDKVPEALNPVFYRGNAVETFVLERGEHFVIGSTTFSLVDHHLAATLDAPPPVTEQTLSYEFLRHLRFDDANRRIDALSQLPETFAEAIGDDEQFAKFLGALLQSLPNAVFIGIVEVGEESAEVKTSPWECRDLQRNQGLPSERLIRESLAARESVVHTWHREASGNDESFTQHDGADWAFCVPFSKSPTRGVYVAGNMRQAAGAVIPGPGSAGLGSAGPVSADVLAEDVKFVALAVEMLEQLRELRHYERETANLRQFISPIVIESLAGEDPSVALAPREADVSVLFCDLRGFSRRTERESDNLLGLLHRVSDALGVMTRQILEHDGVIGDFHGDAAMGFWGWPLSDDRAAQRACQAALAIRREFFAAAADPDDPLSDFRMGIGIATGRAVAGKIGTADQVKVTVFGPVVNLAARMESMTKILRTSILLDEGTAAAVNGSAESTIGRVRRIARIRPPGIDTPVEVNELLPAESEFASLPNEGIAAYEAALDAFYARDWEQAFSLLHQVPSADRVKDFLTVFIARNNRQPPDNWDGTVPLDLPAAR